MTLLCTPSMIGIYQYVYNKSKRNFWDRRNWNRTMFIMRGFLAPALPYSFSPINTITGDVNRHLDRWCLITTHIINTNNDKQFKNNRIYICFISKHQLYRLELKWTRLIKASVQYFNPHHEYFPILYKDFSLWLKIHLNEKYRT